MPKRKRSTARLQVAALPWRRTPSGALEIVLVTSRETRRLIVPKGWVSRGMPGAVTAASEAFEEAGLLGRIAETPIGAFDYDKRFDDGEIVRCRVEVYPFAVTGQADAYPERGQRMIHWFPLSLAIELADDAGLVQLLRKIARGKIALEGQRG